MAEVSEDGKRNTLSLVVRAQNNKLSRKTVLYYKRSNPQAKQLHSEGKSVDVIVGARNKSLLMYTDEFERTCDNLYLITSHHRQRSDGKHAIVAFSALCKPLEHIRDKSLISVGAVIGNKIQVIAGPFKLG